MWSWVLICLQMHFLKLSLISDCLYNDFSNNRVWVPSLCIWEDASQRLHLDDCCVSFHNRVWRFESKGSCCSISARNGAIYRTLRDCSFCSPFLDALYSERIDILRSTDKNSVYERFKSSCCNISLKLLLSIQKAGWWMIF